MAKKNKIPKKIAGVKIPKVLRKNSLLKGLLGSSTGRQIVANALMAAAGAAATALADTKTASKAAHSAAGVTEDSGRVLKRALKSAAKAMTEVVADAARSAIGEGGSGQSQSKPSRNVATH